MNLISNCLDLFQTIPLLDSSPASDDIVSLFTLGSPLHSDYPLSLLSSFGVLLHPNALSSYSEVKSYLESIYLSGNELNKAFHKSWHTILQSTPQSLLSEQLIHYFSTYGLQSLHLYSSDTIYIPSEYLNIPSSPPLPLKLIKATSPSDIIVKCESLLHSGVALKQSTIIKILDILEALGYPLSSLSTPNKEASILIIDRTGQLPSSDDELFRYLFFKTTGGRTLVINDSSSKSLIKSIQYPLPPLSDTQLISLSRSFNRHKDLWLTIKSSHKSNVPIVNRIAKLSKKHHSPLKVDVLNSLTHKHFDLSTIESACSSSNTFRLIRSINALRYYLLDKQNRTYLIRNGKSFSHLKPSSSSDALLLSYHDIILSSLKNRLKPTSVFYPSWVDYTLPSTEKSFIGNIPLGTIVSIPPTEESFLLGVYWQGDRVDLDLRADSPSHSVGWNTSLKDDGLLHSGDITSAPYGATEWLYSSSITDTYEIKLNGYSYDDLKGQDFTLILGYGSSPDSNYIIDPSKVIFQSSLSLTQTQMTLGFLEPSPIGLSFYLGSMGSGSSIVGSSSPLSSIRTKSFLSRIKSSLKLSDLLPSTPNAPINLSPSSITKDSLFDLFLH